MRHGPISSNNGSSVARRLPTDVALFALDSYQGQIVADLFGERSYFADADQFWTLQNQAIAAKRDDQLLEAGWCEVTSWSPVSAFTGEHEKTTEGAGGKVYITVTHGGEVEIHEGYLTRKEARRVKAYAKDVGLRTSTTDRYAVRVVQGDAELSGAAPSCRRARGATP